MDGFEDVEELNVKRAVRVPGRTELDSATHHLKPGDDYTVSIYLRNQSKKKKNNIKISNVNVHRIVNDKDSVVSGRVETDRGAAEPARPGGNAHGAGRTTSPPGP